MRQTFVMRQARIRAKQIDEAKVEEARKRAESRLQEKLTDEETAVVSAALMHTLAQLKVKQRQQTLMRGLFFGTSGLPRFGLPESDSGFGKNRLRLFPELSSLQTVAIVALVVRSSRRRSSRRNFVAYATNFRPPARPRPRSQRTQSLTRTSTTTRTNWWFMKSAGASPAVRHSLAPNTACG